jgi:hypothetical protein
MDKPIAKLKLLTTKGEVVDAILYCHQETTTIAGTTYYLLKLNTPADASGTTLQASTASVARVVWGKFVYPLAGIAKILASTIYATYRAYTGGGTVNAEIDILIRKADGTVRTTIATGVSKSANLGTSWATYTGANYSFAEYTVVDQTDYLEIDYVANVTAKKATQYAYLRIDDNTLDLADQTRSQEWKFTGVTTLSATNITINSATLNGQINGTETLTIRGFEWGTQSGNYTGSWTESGTFPPDTFSYNLTNLSPETTYYFRAKAYSDATGWIYGNEVAFTTLSIFPVGWSYRKSHVINPASGAGTNYQVRIVAHYGSGTDSGEDVYLNGKCRTDFGDIRFTRSDGVSLLDYWMEEKVDGDYAVFWVEVADDLSSNPVTIYIYYGKSDATTKSDASSTFICGTDFDKDDGFLIRDNGVDESFGDQTGEVRTGGPNQELYFSGDRTHQSWVKKQLASTLTQNFAIRIKFKFDTGTGYSSVDHPLCSIESGDYPQNDPNNYVLSITWLVAQNYLVIREFRGTTYTASNGIALSLNTWYVAEMRVPGTTATLIVEGVGSDTKTVTLDDRNWFKPLNYITGWSSQTNTHHLAFAVLRKYVDPEPSHGSWGSEETVAVAEAIVAKNFPMDYLPSPAKAEQLTSKVSGATITTVSQDYPLTLIKKDKAQELISKFTAT